MKVLRRALLPALALAALVTLAVVLLSENALRINPVFRVQPDAALAAHMAASAGAAWEAVEIRAADGATLRAWHFRPHAASGEAVLLLHGVADTRRGMLGHADMLLRHGYAALVPDSRGHGSSDGGLITYGLREAGVVQRWRAWLAARGATRVYGLGVSMGAAILLQSLEGFQAVVAESPFATFREIARDRLPLPVPLSGLLIEPAFLYTRLRYGLDLNAASPAAAVARAKVPVLLIQGGADTDVPPRHARLLAAANPAITLWMAPGAAHTQVLSHAPVEYERRVLEWFRGVHARLRPLL